MLNYLGIKSCELFIRIRWKLTEMSVELRAKYYELNQGHGRRVVKSIVMAVALDNYWF